MKNEETCNNWGEFRTAGRHSRFFFSFLSAVIIGLIVHLYKFTNNFPFFDSYYNFYSSQDMIASGRWFLSAACALSSYFDLPWMNGVLSLLFMAITAAVIAEVFEMRNPWQMAISSGLLVSFPAITETMFFEYAADGYMLAMFLSALSVYFSRMEVCGSCKHFLLSAALLCLACGIYQSYISFALILAICYFIGTLLENRYDAKTSLKWVGYQAAIYITGLLLYYVIWQWLLKMKGITAVNYQGVAELGAFYPGNFIAAVQNTITSFTMFFLERNPLHQGWTVYSALSCITCVVFLILLIIACIKSGIYKRKVELLLMLLCLLVIPYGCYLCYFISPGIVYYTRMLQCIAILFVFTGVLCERWIQGIKKTFVFALLAAVTMNYSVMANVCYTYLDRSYEKAYATMVEMSTRIHMEDDGTAKYVTFCGMLDSMSEDADIDNSQLGTLGPLKLVSKANIVYHDHMMLFLSQYTNFTLSYYRTTGEELPQMEIADGAPVPEGYEFHFPVPSLTETQSILAQSEVAQMGIWPAKDSVKLIGDTIVVKLSAE